MKPRVTLHIIGQDEIDPVTYINQNNIQYAVDFNEIPLLAAAWKGQKDIVEAILGKDPDLIKKVDKNDGNILHVSAYHGQTEIIKYCFNRYKADKQILSNLINHLDKFGTTPLGAAFLSQNNSNLAKIEIATEFAGLKEYSINSYLNTKGMDCINSSRIGGSTLLHQVIFLAANTLQSAKADTRAISEFFKTLKKRNNEAEDKDLFNPDYPVMNPYPFNYTSHQKNL